MCETMFRVLVCDPVDEAGLNLLRKRGLEIDIIETPTEDELKKLIKNYHVIIVRSATKVTPAVIDNAINLKIIARAGVGLDNIAVDYARKKGIKVVNAPESLSIAVAEHTILLILALSRHLFMACKTLKEGKWLKKKFMGEEIYGKTLGIIGLGKIGSEVAKRAKALGMEVIGYKRHNLEEVASKLFIKPAKSLEDLLSQSDIITLHVPLTKETYHMIDEKEFEIMKDGVLIVNTSRGAVINGRTLLKYLKNRKVRGAALDVYENEPPKEDWEWELIRHPNVIATPHIGSMTREAQRKASLIVAEKIFQELGLQEN